jgi:hypothetical protein
MRKPILAGVVVFCAVWCAVFCAAALAQTTLTVERLAEFIHSSTHEMKGKQSDKDIARFIAGIKLTERLDDATIEEFQNEGAGPLTVAALRALGDRTANLPAAKPAPLSLTVAPKPMPPPPSSEEQAAIIDSIRAYALNYSQSLPDFVCHESMKEYQAPRSSDRWTKLDNDVDSKLTYFQQKEDYKPISVGGKLTSQDYDKLKGSKSIGDFGSMLRGIFEPSTQTRFEWRTWSTWDHQPSMTFDYHVSRERSNYQIFAEDHRSVITAYSGYFVVDARTRAVVKLNVTAEGLPKDFPVQSAESTLVYREQDLSGHTFLLPSNLEVIMGESEFRSKIEKQFAIYRKYSADSEITFDTVDDPPVVKKK